MQDREKRARRFQEELARRFGVSRMPEPLAWFDTGEVLRRLPPDFKLDADNVHVTFDVDVDETGKVTEVRAVTPRLLGVGDVRIHLTDAQGRSETLRPVPAPPAVRDAVVAAAYGMRFRPAERDGRPVPLQGLRLGAGYSRGDLMRDAK